MYLLWFLFISSTYVDMNITNLRNEINKSKIYKKTMTKRINASSSETIEYDIFFMISIDHEIEKYNQMTYFYPEISLFFLYEVSISLWFPRIISLCDVLFVYYCSYFSHFFFIKPVAYIHMVSFSTHHRIFYIFSWRKNYETFSVIIYNINRVVSKFKKIVKFDVRCR